jgi:hypothetical protein
MFRLVAISSATAAAALMAAAPAHCDANSYLAYLASHRTFVVALDNATIVSYGLHACEMLHSGMTPEQIGSMLSVSDIPGIVDAAQHELCPDTLH